MWTQANGKQASFTLLLNDQADLSKAYGMEEDARGWYVYRTLKRHAARTQAPIRAALEARNIPYRAHYVANVIFAEGDGSDVDDGRSLRCARDRAQRLVELAHR